MTKPDAARCIQGKPISPGMAEGMTYLHGETPDHPDLPVSIETRDVDQECQHLERAITLTTENLLALATRVEQEMAITAKSGWI